MAAVEYAKPSCETDEENQDRLVENGAAPEVRFKRTSPTWRVLATVVGGVLLLAAVVGATVSLSPKNALAPHRDSVVVHGPRAQTRRPIRLNKVFAMRVDPGFPKTVSLHETGEHSIQDDVRGAEQAAAGEDEPSFDDIDADGDGQLTFKELRKFIMQCPGVTKEMWHEHKDMIKHEFDSADEDGDGMLSEEEFTAATQPGAACTSHQECDEFCYEGQCAPCDECHYCWDGIDDTCGTCGDGFPTEGDACE